MGHRKVKSGGELEQKLRTLTGGMRKKFKVIKIKGGTRQDKTTLHPTVSSTESLKMRRDLICLPGQD